jgi:hypothetical protein
MPDTNKQTTASASAETKQRRALLRQRQKCGKYQSQRSARARLGPARCSPVHGPSRKTAKGETSVRACVRGRVYASCTWPQEQQQQQQQHTTSLEGGGGGGTNPPPPREKFKKQRKDNKCKCKNAQKSDQQTTKATTPITTSSPTRSPTHSLTPPTHRLEVQVYDPLVVQNDHAVGHLRACSVQRAACSVQQTTPRIGREIKTPQDLSAVKATARP